MNENKDDFIKKYSRLNKQINQLTKENVIVAFSGGVDSAVLLQIACNYGKQNGTKVFAVNVSTTLHPRNDAIISKRVAGEMGAEFRSIEINELREAGIENNPKNRCYLCKKCIFSKIKRLAEQLGVESILDGTNEDDLHTYRPGIKALRELEIISPLAENFIAKTEVRMIAKELDISVADRPSMPCMATRIPYGQYLDAELLKKIEMAEKHIRNIGFYNVRVRVYGNSTRIEVDENNLTEIIKYKKNIIEYMKQLGFIYVTLDLEGFRSGSMDI